MSDFVFLRIESRFSREQVAGLYSTSLRDENLFSLAAMSLASDAEMRFEEELVSSAVVDLQCFQRDQKIPYALSTQRKVFFFSFLF